MKKLFNLILVASAIILLFASCNTGDTSKENVSSTVQSSEVKKDTLITTVTSDSTTNKTINNKKDKISDQSIVLVYNFHVTRRCPGCIAIEEATTKTLNTYFAPEKKNGRVKQYILNVDEEANKQIAEKYEAFGSGLFVTRVYKGKETTSDLTGDGFKYAKNKEEKFIEILKNKITEYLK